MNNKILILISFLTIITSCKKNKLKYCKNEIELISPEKEIKVLNFNLTDNFDSISRKLDSELNLMCDIENLYGIKVNDIKLKTYIVKACNTTYQHRMFAIDITLNNEGKALIDTSSDTKVLDVKEISNWFIKNYPLNEYKQLNNISLSWTKDISDKKLNSGINEVINGYLRSVNKISIQKFKKKLCSLSKSEINKIKSILPFKFELRNFSKLEIH